MTYYYSISKLTAILSLYYFLGQVHSSLIEERSHFLTSRQHSIMAGKKIIKIFYPFTTKLPLGSPPTKDSCFQ
jgi:hypothetical protein